ncbi:glycosyltransferase [Ekhidna sp.]|uniref:glycosyltransferase n=1 Tax=Ekhidna sp. TaxID=2608089 RepID=UPI003298AC79
MKHSKFAIIAPNKPALSETFIQAHLEYLEPDYFFYGGSIPLFCNEKSIQPFWLRGLRRMVGEIKNRPNWHDLVAFRNKLKREKVNVILVEYGTLGASIANVCKDLEIQLVVHFHGIDATKKADSSGYEKMFQVATTIIAVSNTMKEDLIGLGCPTEKIVVNPCGPNPVFEQVNTNYEKQNIIALGRFVNKKAPYYLVLAFKKISKKFPDARLTMVGDGPLKEVCTNLIQYLKLNDKIQLVGARNKEEIIKYFNESSIFIQHSIESEDGDKEGSPVAVMEAGLAALPIISTRHAGINETVVDNITGFLVDEHDVDTFAEKLEELLTSGEMRKEMGMKGRQHVKNHFSMENHISILNQIILQAIKNG